MGVKWIMADGSEVIVPQDILSQDLAAQQAFYDNQARRVRMEQDEPAPAVRKRKEAEG